MSTIASLKNHGAQEDTIDISEMIGLLLENKLLIIVITTICLGLGALFVSRQTPQFQANVLIQIEEHNRGNLFGSGTANQGFWGFNRSNGPAIQTALIKSRVILDPVCQMLGLNISAMPKQSFFKRLISPTHANIKIDNLSLPENYINKPLDLLYDKKNHAILYDGQKILAQGPIHFVHNKNESIKLNISKIDAAIGMHFSLMKRPTENIAQEISNRIVIEDLGGRQPIGILSVKLQDSNPAQAVRILNQITKITQQRDARKKSLEASKTLQFLYQQLPITKKSLEKAEIKLNQYRARSGKINFKFQSQALLEQFVAMDKHLAELRINQADMEQQYTIEHPSLIALNQKITKIEQSRAELEKKLKDLPASDQIALNLSRDVKVQTTLYTTLLNEIQKLKVVKAGTISDVNILSTAKLPNSSLPSRGKIIYLGSILLGLIISIMVIYARKLIFPKVEDPRWSEQQFNIVNLATIPYSKEQQENALSSVGSRKHLALLAQTNPRNLSIEALRSLRTSLQINLSCSNNNIISILGIAPGVGKTFVSTNLSYLLATAEKRVLLIDADLRRGTAHLYFNTPASPGFSELINGTKTVEEVLKPTTNNNLTILPRGDYPADPAELLSSTRCKELIHAFSKQYDIVIIDTAPVLLVTDSVLIGSISTTNYLVLGSNAHTHNEVEIAIKRLQNADVTINGSIFNFHNMQSQRNPYYYRYYNYNYYDDNNGSKNNNKKFLKRKKKPILQEAK